MQNTIIELNSFIMNIKNSETIFVSNITTNGYLLGLQDFKDYYNVGITDYQITIDGFNHDKYRPLTGGGDTLATILKNLDDISRLNSKEFKFNIILRNNISKTNNDLKWYDFLKSRFGHDSRFKVLVRTIGDWGGEDVKKLDNLIARTEQYDYLKEHVDYLKKIGLKDMNSEQFLGKNICYAGYKNSYVFRGNGKIEKCTMSLDHPSNLVGYIDNELGIIINEDSNKRWYSINLKDECTHCSGLLTCFNHTCPKKKIIDSNYTMNCDEIKELVF